MLQQTQQTKPKSNLGKKRPAKDLAEPPRNEVLNLLPQFSAPGQAPVGFTKLSVSIMEDFRRKVERSGESVITPIDRAGIPTTQCPPLNSNARQGDILKKEEKQAVERAKEAVGLAVLMLRKDESGYDAPREIVGKFYLSLEASSVGWEAIALLLRSKVHKYIFEAQNMLTALLRAAAEVGSDALCPLRVQKIYDPTIAAYVLQPDTERGFTMPALMQTYGGMVAAEGSAPVKYGSTTTLETDMYAIHTI